MKINFKSTLLAALFISINLPAENNAPETRPANGPDSTTRKSLAVKKEEGSGYRAHNVIKCNLSQLAIGNLSFQYEFAFHKNMSISCGFSRLLNRPLNGLFTKDDPTGEGLRNTKYNGFAITPEFRVYPGKKIKHQAPRGFYLAAYLRYAKYSVTSFYQETYDNENYSYNFSATYSGATGGLMIGYQWIIARHLSIDLWIIGAGFGSARLSMNTQVQGLSIPPDEQAHIKETLSSELAGIPYLHITNPVIETTDHSVQATVNKLPMLSVRAVGLCIGFAF